jgi:hypothetical protein
MPFSKALLFLLPVVLAGCQVEVSSDSHQTLAEAPVWIGEVPADSLELRPNEGLMLYHGEPFSGKSQKVVDGIASAEVNYWRGKKSGKHTLWFANGTKSYECAYARGKKEGKSYSWWKNGNLRSESTFESGAAHGVQKQWYISGSLFKQLTLVDGKEEGMQQSWRENGKLYSNYEAKNGRIFGLKRSELCYELADEKVQ